ncbi:hypothetical protein FRC12_006359 [Ceratobasidium sp. 428]|nr:hypothetical protein FRC12_006359 [Ceratobasidium sp. 428]
MEAVVLIVLGAGAIVTTTVAAAVFIHRKLDRVAVPADDTWVQVDLAEKGMGEGLEADEDVYEAKRGAGWKEYSTEEQQKVMFDPGVLAPLVLHDEMITSPIRVRPGDHTPLGSTERLPLTPPRWQPPPSLPDAPLYDPYIPPTLERSPAMPIPLLEGPEGGPEHVDQALDTNITSMPEAEVADTLPTGIISWPAMVPSTPADVEGIGIEDILTPMNETPTVVDDLPPEPADLEPTLQLEIIPPTPPALVPISLSVQIPDLGLDIKSPIVQDEERTVPVIDLKSPIHTELQGPSSHSVLEEDLLPPPPVYTRYDTAKSPIDPKFVGTILSPLSPQPTTVNIFVTEQEAVFAARVPLPMSIPSSPKPVTLLRELMDECPLVFDTKESREFDAPDVLRSPTKPPFVASISLFIPPTNPPSGMVPGSPVSDADSESDLDSDPELLSAPTSPTELKQPVLPPPEVAQVSKDTSVAPVTDIIIGEVMTIPEDPNQPEPTPDPAEPALALLPFLPGSFDPPQSAVSVSLMTGDVFQLCRAVVAVSNCAGLVAQFVVGFSMWWSLMLVPT